MTSPHFPRSGGCLRLLVAATAAATVVANAAAADDLPALEQWRFYQPIDTLHVAGAQDLNALFAAKDYRLAAVTTDRTIPRMYLRRLVPDLHTVEPVRAREALFIRICLPLVARANAEILDQRSLLKDIMAALEKDEDIAADKAAWLDALGRLYGGDPKDPAGLLERVDIVPPSLAIAQAIDESGWGTAPLALQSNGMFGEHAPPGLSRGSLHVAGTKVDVAAFPSLLDGALAYITNINRHHAYAKLRALRAQRRREGRQPDGLTLAAGLVDYSARGMAYVAALRHLIKEHRLHEFDTMRLDPNEGSTLIHASR